MAGVRTFADADRCSRRFTRSAARAGQRDVELHHIRQCFGPADQQQLQHDVVTLVRRGCHVLLSNSTADEIGALYDTNLDAHDAGLRAFRVPAQRSINSKASGRGPVDEYLITNGAAATG